MVFTPGCVDTLARYGYEVGAYVLTPERRLHFLENRDTIATQQWMDWSSDFLTPLTQQVKFLYDALNG